MPGNYDSVPVSSNDALLHPVAPVFGIPKGQTAADVKKLIRKQEPETKNENGEAPAANLIADPGAMPDDQWQGYNESGCVSTRRWLPQPGTHSCPVVPASFVVSVKSYTLFRKRKMSDTKMTVGQGTIEKGSRNAFHFP